MRDDHVPNGVLFGVLASAAIVSVVLVLLIRPRTENTNHGSHSAA
jgi:hypothetical protein